MAVILNRFTVNFTIDCVWNDMLLNVQNPVKRSFLDFVSEENESVVQSWIETVKGWGVNERGQPSDGGFGYGGFVLCQNGRDSSEHKPEEPVPRRQVGSGMVPAVRGQSSRSRPSQSSSTAQAQQHVAPGGSSLSKDQMLVDAIFSAHSDGILVILRQAC